MTMHELLPIIRQVFPSANTCETLATVVQANAQGHRVLVETEEGPQDIFVKQIDASHYTSKSWPDLRRTLFYLRTEVRFYSEFVPELQARGFTAVPKVYHASYNLEGLIEEGESATDQSLAEPIEWSASDKGGSIIMESIGEPYFQESPITLDQAKETLSAVAALHASAWEDVDLLQKAESRLSRGSYHLKTRNIKELEGIVDAWEKFSSHFRHLDEELFERTKDLGTRIQDLAEYISEQMSPRPTDPYATLSHGDFKSMNCFLPDANTTIPRSVVLVDFASTGVGLGMSDVAMHIHHAVLPENLANGGEELLFNHYLTQLNIQLGTMNKSYPYDIALRHYRLAVVDYFRFFLGRFWKSATPEAFEKRKDSKNTALINRNVRSALAFLDRVDKYLRHLDSDEMEKTLEDSKCLA